MHKTEKEKNQIEISILKYPLARVHARQPNNSHIISTEKLFQTS